MPSRKPKDGFTIIEVMIVLAIAGIILLIVFLAVPALQRSARNVSRKNDATFIASQRQEYDINNHSTATTVGAEQCPTLSSAFAQFCNEITSGFSYYKQSDVYIINNGYTKPTCVPSAVTTCPTYPNLGTIPLVTTEVMITETYLVCNSSLSGATTVGAGTFDTVILYALESASGQINQCLQAAVTGN